MPSVGTAMGGNSLLAGTLMMQYYLKIFILHLRPYAAAIED
jgi:hypothetical protein